MQPDFQTLDRLICKIVIKKVDLTSKKTSYVAISDENSLLILNVQVIF